MERGSGRFKQPARSTTTCGLILAMLAGAAPAWAEIVTFASTAQVYEAQVFPFESPIPFSVGQAATIEFSYERDAPGVVTGATTTYNTALRSLVVRFGEEHLVFEPGDEATIKVSNDYFVRITSEQPFTVDQFDINAAPSGGSLARLGTARFDLSLWRRGNGPFTSAALPELLQFEWFPESGCTVQFSRPAQPLAIFVNLALATLVVPAQPTSWGRVKSHYSR